MKRFFVDKIENPPVLRGEEHTHLSVVLRAKTGDEVVLCNGDGKDYVCRISKIERDKTTLSLVECYTNDSEPTVRVSLFMSVLKGDKNDLVVQKATELGVTDIYPVFTRFVQAHEKSVKVERLNKIAVEAAKQCGRSVLTKVHAPIQFAQAVDMLPQYDLTVFPYEAATDTDIKTYLENSKTDVQTVAIFIGSEGGFAPEEVETLTKQGITPLTLGKRILRAETANIAVLSVVMCALGQWK